MASAELSTGLVCNVKVYVRVVDGVGFINTQNAGDCKEIYVYVSRDAPATGLNQLATSFLRELGNCHLVSLVIDSSVSENIERVFRRICHQHVINSRTEQLYADNPIFGLLAGLYRNRQSGGSIPRSPPLPSTSLPSTSLPSTSLPSTSIPPTSIPLPSTSLPSTSIPPTSIPLPSTSLPLPSLPLPSTSLPPSLPSTSIPSTSIPSTSIPSTSIPSTSIPSIPPAQPDMGNPRFRNVLGDILQTISTGQLNRDTWSSLVSELGGSLIELAGDPQSDEIPARFIESKNNTTARREIIQILTPSGIAVPISQNHVSGGRQPLDNATIERLVAYTFGKIKQRQTVPPSFNRSGKKNLQKIKNYIRCITGMWLTKSEIEIFTKKIGSLQLESNNST